MCNVKSQLIYLIYIVWGCKACCKSSVILHSHTTVYMKNKALKEGAFVKIRTGLDQKSILREGY